MWKWICYACVLSDCVHLCSLVSTLRHHWSIWALENWTPLKHTHSSSFLLISTSTIVLLTFSNTKQLCVPALTASWIKPWQTEDTATSKRNIRRAERHGNLLDVYICLNFSSYVHFCPIVCTFTHAWNRSYSTINIFASRHAHERAKYLNTLFCWL